MKKLICFALLFSLSAMAVIEESNFKVLRGKMHQGGDFFASLKSTNTAKNTMTIKLRYDIDKKSLIPIPGEYLKGQIDQELPLDFIDERGYLALEVSKTRDFPEAKAVYVGRADVGEYKNAHQVKVIAKNGRSETNLFYHPHAPGLGWAKVVLTIHPPLPILRNYTVVAILKEK